MFLVVFYGHAVTLRFKKIVYAAANLSDNSTLSRTLQSNPLLDNWAKPFRSRMNFSCGRFHFTLVCLCIYSPKHISIQKNINFWYVNFWSVLPSITRPRTRYHFLTTYTVVLVCNTQHLGELDVFHCCLSDYTFRRYFRAKKKNAHYCRQCTSLSKKQSQCVSACVYVCVWFILAHTPVRIGSETLNSSLVWYCSQNSATLHHNMQFHTANTGDVTPSSPQDISHRATLHMFIVQHVFFYIFLDA